MEDPGTGHLNDEELVLKGRCDSFVLETDVHYPTDINLLLDAIRKIVFLIGALCDDLGITEWRQYRHILKKIKKQFNYARRLKHSSSKNQKVKTQKAQLIINAHLAYSDKNKKPFSVQALIRTCSLPQCCIKKMKKISQIVKSVVFKVNFSLVSGSHQWCDPGSVRFFSIFFTLRESLRRSAFCNNGEYVPQRVLAVLRAAAPGIIGGSFFSD